MGGSDQPPSRDIIAGYLFILKRLHGVYDTRGYQLRQPSKGNLPRFDLGEVEPWNLEPLSGYNGNMQKITKAIIPAAGLGTRFLPQTKAMPKEMLPIIDKPVIQMVVEEAIAAGVTDIIIVTGSTKRAIEDHFDRSDELEKDLRAKGKDDMADQIQNIAEMANFIYVRQKGEPKGNARPVLNAAHLLSNEPFFVLFADDFYTGKVPRTVQMLETYHKTGKSVIGMMEVAEEDVSKYGIVKPGVQLDDHSWRLDGIIEKPSIQQAPSRWATSGYILTPDILPIIAQEQIGAGGEIVLADSIDRLAQQDVVYGRLIEGAYHDTGTPLAYLQAIVNVALETPEFSEQFRKFLNDRLK